MSGDRTEGLAALLLPCPFCGSVVALSETQDKHGSWSFSVRCEREACLIRPETPWSQEEHEAIAAWNTREAARGVRLPGAAPPNTFLGMADAELARARAKHQGIKSRHEGYAVVLEELDEVKAEVWRDGPAADLLKELVQTAAMCARFAEDVGLVEAGAVPAAPEPATGLVFMHLGEGPHDAVTFFDARHGESMLGLCRCGVATPECKTVEQVQAAWRTHQEGSGLAPGDAGEREFSPAMAEAARTAFFENLRYVTSGGGQYIRPRRPTTNDLEGAVQEAVRAALALRQPGAPRTEPSA